MKKTINNNLGRKTVLVMVFMFLASILAGSAFGATNVSILYGWNGTHSVPVQVDANGALKTTLNLSESTGLSPAADSLYNLGSSALQWLSGYFVNLYATGNAYISGNVGIGTGNPSHKLNVLGDANITGELIVGSGTTRINDSGILFPDGSFMSAAASVPAGTISAFNLTDCPAGWILADGSSGTVDLRGIFIRGAGTSGAYTLANGSYYSAAFGDFQSDSLQGHRHKTINNLQDFSVAGSRSNTGGGSDGPANADTTVLDPITDGVSGTPRTSGETRPASLALIYCMKVSDDSSATSSLFGSSGNSVYVLNTSRNFGVGTTAPSGNLQVDDADNSVSLTVGEYYTSTADTTGISFNSWSDSNVYIDTKLGSGGKIFYRYGEGAQAATASTWMTIEDGKVGIGTTSPSGRLHIKASASDSTGGLIFERLASSSIMAKLYETSGDANFELYSGSTEKVHLDTVSDSWFNGGNVGIGTTGPDYPLQVSGTSAATQFSFSNTANAGTSLCRAGDDGNGFYGITFCTSLARYKKNVVELSLGLESVMQLRPVEFQWDEEHGGYGDIGFIAEDVEIVDPLLADYVEGELQSVKYRQMTALLTKAVQEQQEQIDKFKSENDALRERIEALEAR